MTSADVLRAAESCGAEVTSAISSIDADELPALQMALAKVERRDVAAQRAAKRAKSAAIRKAKV
ncbi:MAG: hypothetical protein IIY62_03300, partial [Kiritimatiellae bacterium]|nr:hypothetical protein [Kiritimatiellia bacterium]